MTLRLTCSASAAALALALGAAVMTAPTTAAAQFSIGFSVNIAPPLIPIFAQPPIPGYGYIWTPGYWAWDPGFGYYWVPGEWVFPPRAGLYWTPGYWAWRNGVYGFLGGYWGPSVGYYGGVDYGYGYGGLGYQGGEWRGGRLYYNRAANNFGGARIATVFSRPLAPRTTSRVSYNGGRGGLTVRPTQAELTASRAPHVQPTATQVQRVHAAAANPAFRAPSVAHGGATAAVTAMHRGDFQAAGKAIGGPATRPGAPTTAAHTKPTGATAGHETSVRPEPRSEPQSDHGRVAQPTHTAPVSVQHREAGGAAAGRETSRSSTQFEGETRPNRASPAPMTPQRETMPRTQTAPRSEMAPHMQSAPRSETAPRTQAPPRPQSGGGQSGGGQPGGGMGRPSGGEGMRPAAPQGRAAPTPSAKPEGGGRPPEAPKGDEKNHPPG